MKVKSLNIICHAMLLVLAYGLSGEPCLPNTGFKALRNEIDRLINQKFLENCHWGLMIRSVKTGELWYEHNSRKNFTPASNIKIFTTVFALEKLGPDFRYRTAVYLKGRRANDSVFIGDLIIRGSGDPTISGRYYEGRVTRIFENWADTLKHLGIRRITGRIIGDDNLFCDERLGKNWEWDSESYWYSAQVGALVFNDNCIDWYLSPTQPGQPARLQIVPNTAYVTVNNSVFTSASPNSRSSVDFTRDRYSNYINAVGTVSRASGTIMGNTAIHNPTLYFATVLRETLVRNGIAVEGPPEDIDDLPDFVYTEKDTDVVSAAVYLSPALNELLKVVNKRSQNLFAEQILRTVSAVNQGEGCGERALQMERTFLSAIGLDTASMVIHDGSGYARSSMVSPADIVHTLVYIREHRHWKPFRESLAIAGVDGTINYRMKNSAAYNNVIAKTGYIDHVRSISGFVKTADQEELVFSILCNHFTVDKLEIEKVQDAILIKLAEFRRV